MNNSNSFFLNLTNFQNFPRCGSIALIRLSNHPLKPFILRKRCKNFLNVFFLSKVLYFHNVLGNYTSGKVRFRGLMKL